MLLFLFVDGLGVSENPESPLSATPLPFLKGELGALGSRPSKGPEVRYHPLDARLDTPGLPQSATGQTTLLTGQNAARHLGYHHGPFPGPALKALLQSASLPQKARRLGLPYHHANGYTDRYLARIENSRRPPLSAFAYAARASGLSLLSLGAPGALDAVLEAPRREARRAAELVQSYPFVVLEFWALDLAGHRDPRMIPELLQRLDAFAAEFLEAAPGATLVLSSDHGNAEEPWHKRHTQNPVPFLAAGPLVQRLSAPEDLVGAGVFLAQALEALADGESGSRGQNENSSRS